VFRNLNLLTEGLPAHAFAKLASLNYLGLAGNLLSTARADWWTNVSSPVPIQVIDMQHNSFETLPAGLFDGLSNSLVAVDLRYNLLTSLPESLFGRLFAFLVTWFVCFT
jgi:hypothetical protein